MYTDLLYFPLTHGLLKIAFIQAPTLLTCSLECMETITGRALAKCNDLMSTMSIRKYLYQKFMPHYLFGIEEISCSLKQNLPAKLTLESGPLCSGHA